MTKGEERMKKVISILPVCWLSFSLAALGIKLTDWRFYFIVIPILIFMAIDQTLRES